MAAGIQDARDARLRQVDDRAFDRDEARALLDGLACHLDVEGLALDDQGAAEMTVDGDLDLTLLHLPPLPGLVVAASVAEDGASFARHLLRANMSGTVTHGGTFAMLPGHGEAMLCRLIVAPAGDHRHLDGELAKFVELVRAWRDALDDLKADEALHVPRSDARPHFLRA